MVPPPGSSSRPPPATLPMMEQPPFLTGQMLLALPSIGDPRFERAAILICGHGPDGALGIGLDSVVPNLGFHRLVEQLGIDPGVAPDAPVHRGGPVEPGRGFVVHGLDWGGADTVEVAGRYALTGTIDVLRAICSGRGPTRWIAALGYAGWDGGQLEDELTGAAWFSTPATDTLLFDTEAAIRWRASFEVAGIDPRLLAVGSGTA